MRRISIFLAILLGGVSPALAGITVTSYQTVALANGYAPVSQAQYYDEEILTNVTPATAHASGDWTGPNAGGSTPTWHFVGSADSTSATSFDATTLNVNAAGSFAYDLSTTPDFIDPSSSSIFRPGAAGSYKAVFQIDGPATYAIVAELNQWGRVRLNSFDGVIIFDQINATGSPIVIGLDGTISPGQYQILVGSGLTAPNLPPGVNQYSASGGYEDVAFTVQVPEPVTTATTILIAVMTSALCGRSRRRARIV